MRLKATKNHLIVDTHPTWRNMILGKTTDILGSYVCNLGILFCTIAYNPFFAGQ